MGKASRIRNISQRFSRHNFDNVPYYVKHSCEQKTTYHTPNEANSAAAFASTHSDEDIDYYFCDNCGYYHLSSIKK
jgi:hypothetical protein